MYDVIRKGHVIGALTWLKEHSDHYRNIKINENWYNIVSDDGLSQIVIQYGDPDADFVKGHNIQEEYLHQEWVMQILLQKKLCNNSTQMMKLHIQTHNAIIMKIIIMTILQNWTLSLLKIRLLSTEDKN